MFSYESMSFIINFTITTTVSLMFLKENVRWELEKKVFKKTMVASWWKQKKTFSFDNFIV